MLLCGSDEVGDIILYESDTDGKEHISERQDYSESELSVVIQKESRDTDGAVVEALLGLLYLVDACHGNRVNLEELWKMDDFKVIMSLKRFLFLLKALHFDDRSTRTNQRKIDRL
ncbi:hypothetical protein NPIL_444671 [Nephila pilipes]|uniref:PiggyBac transposable element-derived protein domain-containing protein n=1 Tax=Nephila pilipes TaxID=299642 RepID=A0A8X6IES5_NEPPI|nr:hypothetical protein NPIL_444671 [Nephila pilipes]